MFLGTQSLRSTLFLAGVLVSGLWACGDGAPGGAPRTPRQTLDALLEAHHGNLRGRMGVAFVKLRLADGREAGALLDLPDRMRLSWRDGPEEIVVPGVDSRPRTRRLLDHLRAALLEPLYEVEEVTVTAGDRLRLRRRNGEVWTVVFDPKALVVRELHGPGVDVRFLAFRDTGFARHATHVATEAFGELRLDLRAVDLALEADAFDPVVSSGAPDRKAPPQTRLAAGDRSEDLPAAPELQTFPATEAVVLEAPPSWPERAALLDRLGRTLHEHGRIAAGLPMLDEKAREILVPFRDDPSRPIRPLPEDLRRRVRRLPQQPIAVLAQHAGPLQEVVARARRRLEAFAAEHGWTPAGPMRVIPIAPAAALGFWPTEETWKHFDLRLELPLRRH